MNADAIAREDWRTREWHGSPATPHAHRHKLLNMLAQLDFESVFEFGCGAGENLAAIRERWPHVAIAGIDINMHRWLVCRRRFNPVTSSIRWGDEHSPMVPYDLVLCDAVCMIYRDPEPILHCLHETARKWLVLSEWHQSGQDSFCGDRVQPCDKWVHDYRALIGRDPVRSEAYTREDWPGDRCDNWWAYGRIMVWQMPEEGNDG